MNFFWLNLYLGIEMITTCISGTIYPIVLCNSSFERSWLAPHGDLWKSGPKYSYLGQSTRKKFSVQLLPGWHRIVVRFLHCACDQAPSDSAHAKCEGVIYDSVYKDFYHSWLYVRIFFCLPSFLLFFFFHLPSFVFSVAEMVKLRGREFHGSQN